MRPLVPAGLQVKDSAKQAKDQADELNGSMAILKYFLLGFGALSLLVGAFVIFNTLSITVAQRTREFATLRTLGGSRKQVMRSVIAEGFVIGLLASVLGLLAGIGLAKGLLAMFAAMGVELPDASTVIALAHGVPLRHRRDARHGPGQHPAGAPRHAGAADRGGPRGLDAAAVAVRAARVQGRPRGRGRRVAAVAAGLSGGSARSPGPSLLGGGVLALFAGVALVAPRLVVPARPVRRRSGARRGRRRG